MGSIAAVAVIIVIFCVYLTTRPEKKHYLTEAVTRGDIVQTVSATGTVTPVILVSVGTQISGTIQTLYADFNSPVRKGQIIAEMDPRPLQATVAADRAAVSVARASLNQAMATAYASSRYLKREEALFSRELISSNDLDDARATAESDLAKVASARASVQQAEANLKKDETNLGYTKIYSPVDGVVVERSVDVGQTVAASLNAPTLFTIANNLKNMQIEAAVDEADIGNVREGMDVTFTVDAFPDDVFHGKVSQVRLASTTTNNVVTYTVIVNVDNSDLRLKPQMTANISIIVKSKRHILRIPNAALRYHPGVKKATGEMGNQSPYAVNVTGSPTSNSVWVLDPGAESPRQVHLMTGITDGIYTEVLSGKLREGERVVTAELTGKGQEQQTYRRGPF